MMNNYTVKYCSTKVPCTNNCLYCFSKWNYYKQHKTYDQIVLDEDKINIIYPCCDGEFFLNSNWYDWLLQMAINKNKIIISFSTKNNIDDSSIVKISNINNYLIKNKQGFIKISIPLVTKHRLNEIEKNTSDYNERMRNLWKISQSNIATSVNIRPILPFISESEYIDIINDTSLYTNYYLIGDLYFDYKSDFYNKYLKSYKYTNKKVHWAYDDPIWNVIESKLKKEKIEHHIEKNKLKYSTSDVNILLMMESEVNTFND